MSLFLPFWERNVSKATKRATECGFYFALFLLPLFRYVILGSPSDVHFSSLTEIVDRNLHPPNFWKSLLLYDPTRASLVLSLIGGSILRFIMIRRNVRCKAPPVESVSAANIEKNNFAESAHLYWTSRAPRGFFLKVDPSPVGQDSVDHRKVLSEFVRCLDLRLQHAIFLPANVFAIGLSRNNQKSQARVPTASDDAPLNDYIAQYLATCSNDRLDARRAWFKSRNIELLLAGGSLSVAVSIDGTILDLLSELCRRFGTDSLCKVGLIVQANDGKYEPNPLLFLDAPLFPFYDEEGEPIGLSHSLSPICGVPGNGSFHDLREIALAGAEDGSIVVTSGVHYSVSLRANGYHAVAIQPHVWAQPEVVAGWMLLGAASAVGDNIERLCHHLAVTMAKHKIRKVTADLSEGFPPIMGCETDAHRYMPKSLFRQFVVRYLAPALKEYGIEVKVQSGLFAWYSQSFLHDRYGSIQYILRRAGYDMYGEDALFRSAAVLVEAGHPWEVPRIAPKVRTKVPKVSGESKYSFHLGPDKWWSITFGSETCKIRNSFGIRYIVALLEHPNEETYAKDLIGSYGDKNAQWHGDWVVAEGGIDQRSGDKAGADSYSMRLDSQTSVGMSNKRMIDFIQNQLIETEKEINDRQNEEDEAPTNERSSLEPLSRLMTRKSRLGERYRMMTAKVDHSPQVKKVAKNLSDTLKKIEEAGMTKLSEHLKETLPPLETDRLSYKQFNVDLNPDWDVYWGPRPSASKN